MPKSRHGKKRSFQHKKARAAQSSPVMAVPQQPAIQTVAEPVSRAPAAVTTSVQAATQYPYILAELKTIAILTGIVLAILIVLALVLPRAA